MTARKKLGFNYKKFIFSVAAVFALVFVYDFIVHQNILSDLYGVTSEIWREIDDCNMLPMVVSQILFALIFVFIFTLNSENKGIEAGMRFGFYIGLLLASLDLATYTYLPIPFALTISWMLASLMKSLLSGIVTALIYSR